MGFTVEDMMVVSKDRYRMKLVAGNGGWSNSISWLLMLEDIIITHNFTGKELAVTTGLGFPDTQSLMALARQLVRHHASGLLINTGRYILEIPAELKDYCDVNDLPLLTVPWDVVLADLIKDLSIRIFLQSDTDEQITQALIHAIEYPQDRDDYSRHLLSHFDIDGTFQVVTISTGDLDQMDTVDRRRLSYRMHLYLSNLTHNGHFFYYDSAFVLVINALTDEEVRKIVTGFERNLHNRMPDRHIVTGISDPVMDISRLQTAYRRSRAALSMAWDFNQEIQYFADMGLYRLLYLLSDHDLLADMSVRPLQPLIEYDRKHNSEYIMTLENYLLSGGSIQAVADAMFAHKNTVLYGMGNIRRILGTDLETQEDRLKYQIACLILHMGSVRYGSQAF